MINLIDEKKNGLCHLFKTNLVTLYQIVYLTTCAFSFLTLLQFVLNNQFRKCFALFVWYGNQRSARLSQSGLAIVERLSAVIHWIYLYYYHFFTTELLHVWIIWNAHQGEHLSVRRGVQISLFFMTKTELTVMFMWICITYRLSLPHLDSLLHAGSKFNQEPPVLRLLFCFHARASFTLLCFTVWFPL